MGQSYNTKLKHLIQVFSYFIIHNQCNMQKMLLKWNVIHQPDAVLNWGGFTQIHIPHSKYGSIFHYEFPHPFLFLQTPIPLPVRSFLKFPLNLTISLLSSGLPGSPPVGFSANRDGKTFAPTMSPTAVHFGKIICSVLCFLRQTLIFPLPGLKTP